MLLIWVEAEKKLKTKIDTLQKEIASMKDKSTTTDSTKAVEAAADVLIKKLIEDKKGLIDKNAGLDDKGKLNKDLEYPGRADPDKVDKWLDSMGEQMADCGFFKDEVSK